MLTVFFNGTREYKIAILPEGQKMNSTSFIECIECVLRPLTEMRESQGRGTQETRVMLHFDNAPVHNTEGLKRV
jgi:hypothetical protein